jgi:MFS family permease
MVETSGRYDRRNFYLNVAEGGFYVAGASLISSQTVLPALVTRLGGGSIAIGALGVIAWVGLFLPQLFASRYGQTLQWKKPWVLRFGIAQRSVIVTIAVILLWLGNDHRLWALGMFLTLYALNQTLMGITTPVWFDLFAKLTPLRRRGRLTSLRTSLAGGMGFVGGIVLTWILTTFDFPASYVVVFLIAGVFQFIGFAFQSQLIEELPSRIVPRETFASYVDRIRTVVRENEGFRVFLKTSIFLVLAATPLLFFTAYALERFNAFGSNVGVFTLVMVTGQIAGSILNGWLADHRGNKVALFSASAAMLAATLIAVLAPSLAWFRPVFFFSGMYIGSELMIRYNLAIEYGPVEQRSTYIGLMNTVLAPLYAVGLLSGWLVHLLGYPVVFVLGSICSLIGMHLLVTRVKEPRQHFKLREERIPQM